MDTKFFSRNLFGMTLEEAQIKEVSILKPYRTSLAEIVKLALARLKAYRYELYYNLTGVELNSRLFSLYINHDFEIKVKFLLKNNGTPYLMKSYNYDDLRYDEYHIHDIYDYLDCLDFVYKERHKTVSREVYYKDWKTFFRRHDVKEVLSDDLKSLDESLSMNDEDFKLYVKSLTKADFRKLRNETNFIIQFNFVKRYLNLSLNKNKDIVLDMTRLLCQCPDKEVSLDCQRLKDEYNLE